MNITEIITKRFISYKELGGKAIQQLDDQQIHWKRDENDNSIFIIVKHLHGNMLSRFTDFLTSDGEKSWRKRDDEFEEGSATKQETLKLWTEGWDCLIHTLHSLNDHDLQKSVTIRGEKLIVVDALIRQIAHYAYHVGQIVCIAKTIKGKDWQNLSVPKHQSQEFTREMKEKYKS